MSIVLFDNKSDCSGCWACKNICPKNAIEMVSDNEGFKFPVINKDLCIECSMCVKVCPLKTSKETELTENNKKHIGIINLQYTQNYGAVIAAAVLEDVVGCIAGDDYTVCTVNYCPSKRFKNPIAQYADEAKQWGGWKLFLKARMSSKAAGESGKVRGQRFSVFRDTFLNLTKPFANAFDINKGINYSAFITGSDVIWDPKRASNFRADGYFLKFAGKDTLKIAYAPSLDRVVDKELVKLSKCYRENLSYLDFVSVREKSNIGYIQDLTDKKVHHCADPAFLVDAEYYDKMLDIAKVDRDGEKYIYVYILEINQDIVDYANKLAKEKNLKICYYSANHKTYDAQAQDCTSDGPAEFLYRLRNAEYVLTNSFHCVVFSLIFKKKFLSFQRSDVSVKANDLLDMFGLRHRIVAGNAADIDEYIDFEKVSQTLDEIKTESLEYLENALSSLK